ncbi:MAG: hypothetical protein ACP5MB_10585, partial [bacterium]
MQEISVGPAVTYSGSIPAYATSFSLSIYGTGFVAGATISAFSASSTSSASIILMSASRIVYDAYTTGGTVSSNGQVTLTITGVEQKAGTPVGLSPGPYYVEIFYSTGSPVLSPNFPNPVYVSAPYMFPTLTVYVPPSSTSGYPGEGIVVTVSGFPANSQVSVTFGSQDITLMTDANGYATTKSTVPSVPQGTYTVQAYSNGVAAVASFTVISNYQILTSNGAVLNGQYAAQGSVITINATGLSAYQAFGPNDIYDTGLAAYYDYLSGKGYVPALPTGVTEPGSIAWNYVLGLISVNVINGSFNPHTLTFYANGNGQLTISYGLAYLGSTGTPRYIYILTTSASYMAVHSASIKLPSGVYSYAPGSTVSLTVSNLIPPGSTVTPETSKYLGPYQLTLNGMVLTLSTGKTTFSPASGASSATVAFTLPSSVTNGMYVLSVVGATGKAIGYDFEFMVSTPGAAGSASPTIVVNQYETSVISGTGTLSSPFEGYADPGSWYYDVVFDGYNFPAGAAITITVYTSAGYSTYATIAADSNGAFNTQRSLGSNWFEFPDTQGNVPYLIQFTYTISPTSTKIYTPTNALWYYETIPYVSFSQVGTISSTGYAGTAAPVTDYYSWYQSNALAGSTITFYAGSLMPDTVYNVYYGSSTTINVSNYITSFTTDEYGNATVQLTIPAWLSSGTYYLNVAPATSTSTTASLYLTVEVTQMIPAYAFPGEYLQFSWPWPIQATGTYPHPAGTSSTTPYSNYKETTSYGLTYVTVTLNGTAYTTFPAAVGVGTSSVYLNGSFLAPNAAPGTWWYVGLTWTQDEYINHLNNTNVPNGTEVIVNTGSLPSSDEMTLQLVSG